MDVDFNAVVSHLDAEIGDAEAAVEAARQRVAEAEAKLDDLRVTRRGADAFRAYATTGTRRRPPTQPAASRHAPSGQTAIMQEVVQANLNRVITNSEAQQLAAERGHTLDAEQVRNALSYLHRKGVLRKGAKRGTWIAHTDTEAPADTGASDGNTPSDREGGVTHEADETPSPPAEDHHHPQLGASIEAVR